MRDAILGRDSRNGALGGSCWGQSNEVERLNRVVEERSREIEELKTQLARIERALGINNSPTAVQPVSYTPAPQPPQTVTTTQAPATLPPVAGFGSPVIFVSVSMPASAAHP